MKDYIGEVNARTVDADTFLDLTAIAIQALEGRRREIPPVEELCLEDAPPGTIYLTDVPVNQMALSVMSECRSRFPKHEAYAISRSFIFRWLALRDAIHSGRVGKFTRRAGDRMWVPYSVFVAAGKCPLTKEGKLDSSFESRVEQLWSEDEDAEGE